MKCEECGVIVDNDRFGYLDYVFCTKECHTNYLSRLGWKMAKEEHPEKIDLCNFFINKEYNKLEV